MDKEKLEEIKNNFLKKEENLSKYATLSSNAIRLEEEDNSNEIRPPYFHDIDRIIHSLSYTRYVGKTQVFSFNENDHVSNRMIHVQLVSKIARTIGRALNLNDDLIEAIALGHDIGHTPLGHQGERMLNEISLEYLNTMFNHNIQGVRNLKDFENNGNGLNLTIQTLDGIMCHNGEILSPIYEPKVKTKEEFLKEYELSYVDKDVLKKLRPMTLEGCVVRISDIIGYIGRDIEDAINIGLIEWKEVPSNIRSVLGTSNKEIVNTIITDIIINSIDKPYIKMSEDVFKALFDLKKFNYDHIYAKAMSSEEYIKYLNGMKELFLKMVDDITNKNTDSDIYKIFLEKMDNSYLDGDIKRIVLVYIAGMTDEFFYQKVKDYLH